MIISSQDQTLYIWKGSPDDIMDVSLSSVRTKREGAT